MRISDWSSDVCSSDLSENVFQLQDFYHATDEGGEEMKLQQTSYVSGQRLKKDFSQVENAVYFTSQAIVVLQDGQPSTVPGALFVDGNLFDVLITEERRGGKESGIRCSSRWSSEHIEKKSHAIS